MTDRQEWVLKVILFVFVFPSTLFFLIDVFFVGFLPTLEWSRATDVASWPLAVVTAVVTFGFLAYHARSLFEAFSRFRAVLFIVGWPFIAAFYVYMTITFTIPFLVTLIAGSTTEQRYWVKELPAHHKYCRNPVNLREIDGLGRICGLPDEFLDRLYPGAVIVVTGRGTKLGIFVQDVRIPW